MDNETNQVEEIEEVDMNAEFEEGLEDFDAFENDEALLEPEKANESEDEELEEEAEEESETEEETEEEEKTIDTLDDLEIKYLHDSKKLKDIPRDELQTYIQKGMNHDRLQEKLTMSNEQNDDFTEIAKMFDMDVPKLTEALKQQYFEDKAKKESRNVKDVKSEYESSRQNRVAKMTNRFIEKFPDVAIDKLPAEVTEAVAEGKDLVDAYNSYNKDADIKAKADEIKSLNERIKALEKGESIKKQNAKTKKKGIVKTAKGSDGEQHDDFLSGLFGDD